MDLPESAYASIAVFGLAIMSSNGDRFGVLVPDDIFLFEATFGTGAAFFGA